MLLNTHNMNNGMKPPRYRLFSRIDEIPFSTDLKLVTYWSDGSCSVETL